MQAFILVGAEDEAAGGVVRVYPEGRIVGAVARAGHRIGFERCSHGRGNNAVIDPGLVRFTGREGKDTSASE